MQTMITRMVYKKRSYGAILVRWEARIDIRFLALGDSDPGPRCQPPLPPNRSSSYETSYQLCAVHQAKQDALANEHLVKLYAHVDQPSLLATL
jgi:hypothetical protein